MPADLGRHLRTWDGTRLSPALLRAALARAVSRAGAEPHLGEELARRLAAAGTRHGSRGPWIRRPLLPASWVAVLAMPLVPLTSTAVLLALAGTGVAGLRLAWPTLDHGAIDLTTIATAAGLLLVTTMVHELIHAAALLRGGYPPGPVGMGVVFVMPVLWCDVTPVALLPRGDRLRV
ncbi:hypothetical protein DRQ50_12975, partial [bacterium]